MTAEITRQANTLLDEGYRPIEFWTTRDDAVIEPGTRVYNGGEHYFEALRYGTATVLACYEKNPSSWTQKYKRPDVEFLIQRDRDQSIGRWADYHMGIAQTQKELT